MNSELDKLIMLLSSDWYRVEQSPTSLKIRSEKVKDFKLGCRHITQDFIGEAPNYWGVAFSEARLTKTKTLFHSLLAEFDFSWDDTRMLDGWFGRDHDTSKVLTRLYNDTLRLCVDQYDCEISIDPECKRIVLEEWFSLFELTNYQDAALGSATKWDCYLKILGGDCPEFLASYILNEEIRQQMDILLANSLKRLNSSQTKNLLAFYEKLNPGFRITEVSPRTGISVIKALEI